MASGIKRPDPSVSLFSHPPRVIPEHEEACGGGRRIEKQLVQQQGDSHEDGFKSK